MLISWDRNINSWFETKKFVFYKSNLFKVKFGPSRAYSVKTADRIKLCSLRHLFRKRPELQYTQKLAKTYKKTFSHKKSS